MKRLVKAAVSVFYLGYSPVAPGTLGSAAGLLGAWGLHDLLPALFAGLSVAGFFLCRPAVDVFESKDPRQFVLDEVCGTMLAVLWLPKEIALFGAAFVLFRILDISKIWPLSIIQRSKNPLAIMWDDLAAGLMVNIVLQIFIGLGGGNLLFFLSQKLKP